MSDSPASVEQPFRRGFLPTVFFSIAIGQNHGPDLGAFDEFYGPFCGGTLRNRIELHGTGPGQEWQISAVLSMVSRAAQENKWCPEEDSNLHALASAST
jgi:hypothetical protein